MEQFPCRPGRNEAMAGASRFELGPGQQILPLIVMRHDTNRLLLCHLYDVVVHDHSLIRLYSYALILDTVWLATGTSGFHVQDGRWDQ